MEQITTIPAQVSAISDAPAVFSTAPDVLMQNQSSYSKAKTVYDKLNELIASTGMSDVYDEQLAGFIVKVKATISTVNDRRKPITQIIDMVKKEFTSVESDLKALQESAQRQRDAYATEKMEALRKQQEAQRLEAAKREEAITLERLASEQWGIVTAWHLSNCKASMRAIVANMSLEGTDKETLATYTVNTLNAFKPSQPIEDLRIDPPKAHHHTGNELDAILTVAKKAAIEAYMKELPRELEILKQELAFEIPSKIAELEALSKASAEEAERLLAERKAREEAQAKKAEEERLAREQEAASKAAIEAAGQTAAAAVDGAASLFEAPKVAESYEIKMDNTASYLLLTQFWFEKEGRGLTPDAFERMTFGRVKAFCEKWAVKNNEFVQGKGIKYEPVYKAK